MSGDQPTHVVLSFGPFEADLLTQELKKQGVLLRLPGQSFQILTMLLQRPGQLVSREELKQALWPSDTFVDFEKSTNAAINRLREALGDSADNPRYIETLPRRGYRLVVPVTGVIPLVEQLSAAAVLPKRDARRRPTRFALIALILVCTTLTFWYTVIRSPTAPKVLRFTQLTNDGQLKAGPMATDGMRIYFSEVVPVRITSSFKFPSGVEKQFPFRCLSSSLLFSIWQAQVPSFWLRMRKEMASLFGCNPFQEGRLAPLAPSVPTMPDSLRMQPASSMAPSMTFTP